MADKKISELTAASSLVGTELLPIVQDGETKKAAMSLLSIAVRNYLLDSGADLPITPDYLFSHGEQGTWYDPSDFSSMYQDSAGTTPVTAVEQPVGKILDKSGNGNHATQSTTTSRPILRNLYNLLTYTEQFDNAVWAKASASVTANSTTAPDGTNTADTITAVGTSAFVYYSVAVGSATTQNTASIYLKAASYTTFSVRCNRYGASDYFQADGDLSTLTVTSSTGGTGSVTVQPALQSVGSGWYRLTISGVASTTAGGCSWSFTNTPNIYAWGASLVPANEASLPYQRVVTNTLGSGVYDSDVTKFPAYLRADRTDDSYTTAGGGGSTTGFFYCASIILQTAGQTQTLISDTGTNTGYRVRINSSNQVELSAGNGSAYTTATTTDTLSAGQMAVITAWHDGTKLYAQINNGTIAEQAFGTATAGTSALTIGKDNGAASSYFGGGIYEWAYIQDASPSSQIREKTKSYCADKAGVTL